jgi:general secretion pathway protein B
MSFILDALKKSEAERQRQNTPGIANIPEGGGRKSNSKWTWIIGGLLVVNLAVLAGIVLMPDDEAADTSTATPTVVTETSLKPSTPSKGAAEAERNTATVLEPEAVANSASYEAPADPVVVAPQETITAGLPSFIELQAKGVIQLPDMQLDIHVYSGQPADRFVFVNMSKYKESATLAEGPTVIEITPDGVVLEHYGNRFLLPRE